MSEEEAKRKYYEAKAEYYKALSEKLKSKPETIDVSGTKLGDFLRNPSWMRARLNKWARENGYDGYLDYMEQL